MLVGAGLAGEQEITFLAISWYQSVYQDLRVTTIGIFHISNSLKALEPDKLPLENGSLLFAGMAASYREKQSPARPAPTIKAGSHKTRSALRRESAARPGRRPACR
jgi:hypothetical protein